jgi:1,4-alpha-glucan branching enzyme
VYSVCVAGSFNNWEPQQLAFQFDQAGGWEIDLCLPPGDYEYRFVVDGEWTDDPLAVRVVDNGHGGVNAVLSV